eukprot:2234210-Alexandrium_andersonii.AAC.1
MEEQIPRGVLKRGGAVLWGTLRPLGSEHGAHVSTQRPPPLLPRRPPPRRALGAGAGGEGGEEPALPGEGAPGPR